jgi:hypothetical protein
MSSSRIHRRFALAALCFVFTGIPQSAPAADGKKLALLVGVDKYAGGSGFRPLPYTERDVEQLAAILIASGYRPEDVRVLTIKRGDEDTRFFPSFRNIRREFDLLAKGRKPADSLLVALSGHGVKRNDRGSSPGAYFCPLDADITDPATLISLTSLYDMLKESQARVKVMLVDACQNDPTEGKSGAIPFIPPPPPPSVAALFACSEGEVAWDARDLGGGHGVFFHYVIEGLKGQADADHNNQVTLAELAAYTEEKVPDYVSRTKSKRQTPFLQSSGGKIALLDLPRTRKPGPMVAAEVKKDEARYPADAKKLRGKFYKVYPEQLSWHAATEKCQELGGHLAVVTSAEQNRFLITLIREKGLDAVWLGATDEVVEGRWVWVGGQPMRYSNWSPVGRQPNNKNNSEHYLVIAISQQGKWCDQPDESVEYSLGFICQWD